MSSSKSQEKAMRLGPWSRIRTSPTDRYNQSLVPMPLCTGINNRTRRINSRAMERQQNRQTNAALRVSIAVCVRT